VYKEGQWCSPVRRRRVVFLTRIKSTERKVLGRKIMSSCLCFVQRRQCGGGWDIGVSGFAGLVWGLGFRAERGGSKGTCTVGEGESWHLERQHPSLVCYV
jgi:hypothetical protein